MTVDSNKCCQITYSNIQNKQKKYFDLKILQSKYFLLFILDFAIQWDIFIWFGILVFFCKISSRNSFSSTMY